MGCFPCVLLTASLAAEQSVFILSIPCVTTPVISDLAAHWGYFTSAAATKMPRPGMCQWSAA